jgi:hypothetical protein
MLGYNFETEEISPLQVGNILDTMGFDGSEVDFLSEKDFERVCKLFDRIMKIMIKNNIKYENRLMDEVRTVKIKKPKKVKGAPKSDWGKWVKEYMEEHPSLSHAEAVVMAKPGYQEMKKIAKEHGYKSVYAYLDAGVNPDGTVGGKRKRRR